MSNSIDDGKTSHSEDQPLNLDMVRDELGRVPIIGPASDRELYLDLPMGNFAAGDITRCLPPVEREFLRNDFSI